MDKINKGDRVRVTLEDSAVVGEVTQANVSSLDVRADGSARTRAHYIVMGHNPVLASLAPGQPGKEGSDRAGLVGREMSRSLPSRQGRHLTVVDAEGSATSDLAGQA